MSEEPRCPIELKPMKEWVAEEDPKKCRPCMLGPVAQWYSEELKDKGRKDLATPLEQLAEKTDVDVQEQVLTLCEEFDKIKTKVEGPLRERLEDFDCAAQVYDPDAAAEQ